MTLLSIRWAVALPAAASLLLVAGAAQASAADSTSTYTVKLRQPLPRTATTADGAAPQKGAGECAGIPADKDGWHFVLPGNVSHFVKLTVTFEEGGQQVITDFGPPSDKHAYVASEAGDTLTAVVAEITGGELKKFNLSHTCPAAPTTPSTPPATPSGTPSATPSGTPSGTPSTTPSEEPKPSATPTGGTSTAPTGSPTASSSSSSSAVPVPSKNGDGDLAETGSSAPVGVLAAVAVALVGAGGFLAMRRRKTQQH